MIIKMVVIKRSNDELLLKNFEDMFINVLSDSEIKEGVKDILRVVIQTLKPKETMLMLKDVDINDPFDLGLDNNDEFMEKRIEAIRKALPIFRRASDLLD